MIKFYDILLTLLTPLIKIIGSFGLPKRKVTGEEYFKYRDKINVGMILLTKTDYELSNIINPAKIKHAGIYVGNVLGDDVKYVFEAVGRGAVLTDLVTFMTTKDRVVGCEMKLKNPQTTEVLHKEVLKLKGSPYDFLFNTDGKAFYCFELAAACLNGVYPHASFKCREIVKGKRIFDEHTFLDPEFFNIVFDTRKGE